jgi:hypothetical protein
MDEIVFTTAITADGFEKRVSIGGVSYIEKWAIEIKNGMPQLTLKTPGWWGQLIKRTDIPEQIIDAISACSTTGYADILYTLRQLKGDSHGA